MRKKQPWRCSCHGREAQNKGQEGPMCPRKGSRRQQGGVQQIFSSRNPQLCTAQLRGCLHRGTSGTGGAAYLESLHEPYDIGTILIPSYTYHDKT